MSFTEPKFNRHLITRFQSIPSKSFGSIDEELEINIFNTNTYVKGLFGLEPVKLSSLRYSESSTTAFGLQPAFVGVFEGDSLFSYSLTVKPESKMITNNIPNLTDWISQVISFVSIVTLVIGFLFGYYETNIMLLKLMSYLRYSV